MPPELSVLIPTHERPEKLRRTLGRLRSQQSPPEFEVIVTINLGDDRAPVAEAIDEVGLPAELLEAAAPGVSASRNRGWRHARAPLVLFIGDDILASPRLLREHVDWHRAHPREEVGVLGLIRWARELEVTPFMRWLERGLQFDYRGIDGIEAGVGRLYTSNVSIKREMLERVGGFDEDLRFTYEDIELGYRLAAHGFRLLYNRRADAEHLHQVTLESYQRRMRATARGEHAMVAKHPEVEPMLRNRMRRTAATPGRGRLAGLVGVIPPWFPVLGRRVWRSAEQRWMQALAPDFLSAWRETEKAAGSSSPPEDDPKADPASRARGQAAP